MRRFTLIPTLMVAALLLAASPLRAEERAASPAATTAPMKVGQIVPAANIPALRNIVPADTEARFIGDEYGMTAYFITQQQKGKVVYVTPDGQGVMDGSLFGGDGTSTTLQQLSRLRESGFDPIPYIAASMAAAGQQATAAGAIPGQTPSPLPTPAPAVTPTSTSTATPAPSPTISPTTALSPGERLWNDVGAASWIAFGQPSAPQLTVVMDPNCPHCHTYFKMIQPYVQQGKIYLRVLPVSVLDREKGNATIINVLSASSPAAAWTALVEDKPVPAPAQVNPRAAAAVDSNNALFARWRLPGTPYAIYRDKVGGQVRLMFSSPKDLNAFLAELGVAP